MQYCGRFAPSPTGCLHDGSVVAALASWLDAQAHHGRWLVRIEDVDTPRCQPEAEKQILRQLQELGLLQNIQPIMRQSERSSAYADALTHLQRLGLAYPCGCTRKEVLQSFLQNQKCKSRHQELIYPGTCRQGLSDGKIERSWRFAIQTKDSLQWKDRRCGWQTQNPSLEVGDFVLRRTDQLWSYQLAVVVDDIAQGVTHIVRGEDLLDNTARQILLRDALAPNKPWLIYLHTPLVRLPNGEKLSKQHGAAAAQTSQPLVCLGKAADVLGLPPAPKHASLPEALEFWVRAWSALYPSPHP